MTGSHALAALFAAVPSTLNLKGDAYELPVFPSDPPDQLAGKRVAVLSSHGPELPEIQVPMQYLRDRGATVDLLTQDWIMQWWGGQVVIAEWLDGSICVKADRSVKKKPADNPNAYPYADAADYDALIIPGGAWNPVMLRTDEDALNFIRDFYSRRKLIASLCHGPQVLISTDAFPRGTEITGVADIRIDLRNAGFTVHTDDAVVIDEAANLITSRDPKDLGPFCQAIGQRLLLAK